MKQLRHSSDEFTCRRCCNLVILSAKCLVSELVCQRNVQAACDHALNNRTSVRGGVQDEHVQFSSQQQVSHNSDESKQRFLHVCHIVRQFLVLLFKVSARSDLIE